MVLQGVSYLTVFLNESNERIPMDVEYLHFLKAFHNNTLKWVCLKIEVSMTF